MQHWSQATGVMCCHIAMQIQRKGGASEDYAHEVLELQLEALAEAREVLKKTNSREEKLHAKKRQ